MKFSDIDFSALGDFMRNLSEEDMEKMNEMADTMMQNMSQAQPAQEEPEIDYMEGLGLEEDVYMNLPGQVLSSLEAAWDLEDFYDGEEDVDYSASVLFLSKAVLQMLRQKVYPVFHETLGEDLESYPAFQRPASTTMLQDYTVALFDPAVMSLLAGEEAPEKEKWENLKSALLPVQAALARAEFDAISKEDLQALRQLIIDDQLLITLNDSF